MSTPVTFNGVVYSIPAYQDTGYAQGSGNLSSYLIALAGGPYPFTSQTANPASTGTIRLAHSDTIDWRNQANSGDLVLGVNASDQLTFQGSTFATSPVSVSNGGTGDTSLSAYSVLTGGTSSTNPVQSVSGTGIAGQALVSNGPATLPTWQNVAGSGTVNSGTATHLAYYATSTNAVSDANGASISGQYTFSGVTQNFGNLVPLNAFTYILGSTAKPWNNISTAEIALTQNGTGAILGIQQAAGSSTYGLNMPPTQGAANTLLQNDGSGNLSWATSGVSPSYGQFIESANHDITSASFTAVGSVAKSIAASSNTAAIKITVNTSIHNLTAGKVQYLTLFVDNSTNITQLLGLSSVGLQLYSSNSGSDILPASFSVTYVPGNTSLHTYTLYAQGNDATLFTVGSTSNTTILIVEEIH